MKESNEDDALNLEQVIETASELRGALVGLGLFKITKPLWSVIDGKPAMIMTDWLHDPILIKLRDNVIFRLDCIMFHLRSIVSLDDSFRTKAKDANLLLAEDDGVGIRDKLRDLLHDSAKTQSFVFDDVVLHLMSLFEYIGNLTGYLFHGENRMKLKWDGVVTSSRNRDWEVKKTGTDKIYTSFASQRFLLHQHEFVAGLEEYRANIFHYQMLLPKGTSKLSFKGFKHNELTVMASETMTKWLKHVVPEIKERELTLVETALRLVDSGLSRALDVVFHLQQDMDVFKHYESGEALFVSGSSPSKVRGDHSHNPTGDQAKSGGSAVDQENVSATADYTSNQGGYMPRKEHHVVRNPDGGWDVKRESAERASVHTDTKQEAIDRGREISRNQGTELIIHNENGRISQSDSHGKDPRSSKG